MNRSSPEGERKKKITEVKTFPVPFPLRENQENITITTKTPSKPSKEQIISQAFKFNSQGKISEAAKYYQYFINQGFKEPNVFSNYGAILKDLGKLKEAELSYRKAIEIKPDFAEAHFNLGNILKEFGKSRDAELSYRKAIEIKPDFAEAYLYLGHILRVNGKIEEVLPLAKSALKLKTINQGERLQISLQIAINNLILGNFDETLVNINRTIKLINQGGLDLIKNKNQKNQMRIYSQFISSLYRQLKKDYHPSSMEKIPFVGESHCLSFTHQNLSISSKIKKIQPVLIAGGKAWHFANNKNNQWKDSLTQQIKKHNYSDEIFISFGEIDCRKDEGILNYAIKNNKDISEVCEKTIKGYLDYMEEILSANYSQKYYFGVPAPTRQKEVFDYLDVERTEMIKLYNSIFKQEVLSRGSYFLDVYKLTSNKNGVNNNIHMCDDTHLSPKCLSILFEKYLYKS